MGEERLATIVYEAKEGGKWKSGRPRQTWMEEARKACETRGEKWEDVKKMCRDREKWKQSWRRDP